MPHMEGAVALLGTASRHGSQSPHSRRMNGLDSGLGPKRGKKERGRCRRMRSRGSQHLFIIIHQRPRLNLPMREWYYLFAAADEDVCDSKRWPKDINAVPRTPANTERVESEVQHQGVTITVASLDRKQGHTLHSEAAVNRSTSSLDKDEDTVIRTASETEFVPPPVPMTSYSESIHVEETHGDPVVQVDYYINEDGQQVKRIIQRHKTTVTTVRNESKERRETQLIPLWTLEQPLSEEETSGSFSFDNPHTILPLGVNVHLHRQFPASHSAAFRQTFTRSYDKKETETNGVTPMSPENEDEGDSEEEGTVFGAGLQNEEAAIVATLYFMVPLPSGSVVCADCALKSPRTTGLPLATVGRRSSLNLFLTSSESVIGVRGADDGGELGSPKTQVLAWFGSEEDVGSSHLVQLTLFAESGLAEGSDLRLLVQQQKRPPFWLVA
ncbi:unnamed protein product [Schistocephalus solidus]|uniref:TMEM132 domain-containing protein n=1 Tax=Schistocephalus solidus TaxID=70667 RepID=A0A183SUT9_SCHSO|nr:unnamed protein product [Schistocephalus solidus]